MTVLKELARLAIRYGLKPEDIGPVSTFADLEYMKGYIRHIRGFEAPASYGVSSVNRERAQRAWRKVIAKVRKNEAGERIRVNRSPNVQAVKSEGQANSQ